MILFSLERRRKCKGIMLRFVWISLNNMKYMWQYDKDKLLIRRKKSIFQVHKHLVCRKWADLLGPPFACSAFYTPSYLSAAEYWLCWFFVCFLSKLVSSLTDICEHKYLKIQLCYATCCLKQYFRKLTWTLVSLRMGFILPSFSHQKNPCFCLNKSAGLLVLVRGSKWHLQSAQHASVRQVLWL